MQQRFRQQFEASIAAKQAALAQMLPALGRGAQLLIEALRADHKLLVCGNGGSAADAQHFAAELSCRFERERPGLPALALTVDTSTLTAIGNDYSFEQLFARQVQALGRRGDVLLAISTSGNSPNVLKAIEVAQAQQMPVLAFTGRDGGQIARQLRESDVELRVPSRVTARIQEVHILLLHCLCDAIDQSLFPQ
ncbi:D-sedoheptulose 7-phosphate isomerase [Solimonas aquatica]|uniref:Phosphoheptose isomerase n=1 Tax=Solimonas aquatica TaxID=489703 RepID=A0A1H9CUV6_9GAMM|nr:phosphoheptose isomerase [Solimonas aquatica]SEQ04929.1 D-sedoheptulose 7-phosphate isomerase [Solimonas aquatica]